MDYCSTCRRHLNGALVCPGCGAYAPDIAPTAVDSHYVPGVADLPMTSEASGVPVPHEDAPGDLEGVPSAPQGRAARRRQMARWKKNQRRAVVATAVALVGGGLTVASWDRHSTDRVQTATAPDDRTMGAAPEQATEYSLPESASPSTHRSSAKSPRAQSPAGTAPERQSVATAPRSVARVAHPDAAASPQPAAASVPLSLNDTVPSSQEVVTDPAGTAAQQPTESTTGTGAGTGTATGTDAGSAQSDPAPAASSPTQLCVLVLCLG
jgi:hypothetical protein